MKEYIQLSIDTASEEQAEILIAVLGPLGFDGFEQHDLVLDAFIETKQFNEVEFTEAIAPYAQRWQKQILPMQNWNELWETNFKPVLIDDFCGLRAAFHAPLNGVQHELIITPKMSFGTGHHATTELMIRAMRNLDFHGRQVLDFGTGTGVLAILAERMGAAAVVAIDNDDWSVLNAEENVLVNGCSKVTVLKRESLESEGRFDLILANINKNVIISSLQNLSQHLTAGGVLLLSGLLADDRGEITRELTINHFSISFCTELKNWICLLVKAAADHEPAREC